MSMARKNVLAARERRLRRAAARKGLSIRKVRRGQDRGRYLVVYPDFDARMSSHNRSYPHSFSLDEAERCIAE